MDYEKFVKNELVQVNKLLQAVQITEIRKEDFGATFAGKNISLDFMNVKESKQSVR